MALTFGSLFSGIGGLDLGLERAGMRCMWQVEIDDYANKVLAKHWPDVPRFRDVRDVGASNLVPVDLICGGFPCQDVSLAGKRAGLDGQRSTLWGEFARIVRELRPGWVLAENVPGLLSANDGRFFARVLRDLAESGYDAEWSVFPAAAVGAPHIRERVAILANPNGRNGDGWAKPGDGWTGRTRLYGTYWQVADSERQRVGTGLCQSKPGLLWRGRPRNSRGSGDTWPAESGFCRVAHGVPFRVDRLRCLGNAVVPQWAEWIGRQLLAALETA